MKIIITILTVFLGLFGYQNADKVIEARIEQFEQTVSVVQRVISAQQEELKNILISLLSGEDPVLPEPGFSGLRYSEDGYYYGDDKDCWQKGTGYNEFYDKWAPITSSMIDQFRVRFPYDGKNWMIQMWKGQYDFNRIGAEIGIFTCDLDKYNGGTGDLNRFQLADKEDWLKMQLDCYYSEGAQGPYNKVFTRPYDTYWWINGFIKGRLTEYKMPGMEIKTESRITFKSEEQANLFVQGLEQSGFTKASGADTLTDDSYYVNGADVWVRWSANCNDRIIGYSDSARK